MLPNLFLALILFSVFYALGVLVGRISNRAFSRAFGSTTVANLFSGLLKILVLVLGFFVALELVGLQKAVVSLLAGAGIIGLAIAFAFQDMAENLLAGLFMGIRKPFEPGHLVKSKNQFGFVEKMNLRNTILRNFSGQMIYIPNREVFKNVLENYSKTGERRIQLDVGVSYGEDLKTVTEVLQGAIEGLDFRREGKEVEVFALEFGESSINFCVRYWVGFPNGNIGYFNAIDAGIKAIKSAFDEAGILIPFPIRTLDFGAKGGVDLTDSLTPVLNAKTKDSDGQSRTD